MHSGFLIGRFFRLPLTLCVCACLCVPGCGLLCCLLAEMVKFLEPGKIVILTSGRYAGHKAVIIRVHPNGTKDRK